MIKTYRYNEQFSVQASSIGFLVWVKLSNGSTQNVYTAETLEEARDWCEAQMEKLYEKMGG